MSARERKVINTRREGRHMDGCFAEQAVIDGRWPHPWSYFDAIDTARASDGTDRGRGTLWKRLRCNDSDCRAVLLVREQWLVGLAAAEFKRESGGGIA